MVKIKQVGIGRMASGTIDGITIRNMGLVPVSQKLCSSHKREKLL